MPLHFRGGVVHLLFLPEQRTEDNAYRQWYVASIDTPCTCSHTAIMGHTHQRTFLLHPTFSVLHGQQQREQSVSLPLRGHAY